MVWFFPLAETKIKPRTSSGLEVYGLCISLPIKARKQPCLIRNIISYAWFKVFQTAIYWTFKNTCSMQKLETFLPHWNRKRVIPSGRNLFEKVLIVNYLHLQAFQGAHKGNLPPFILEAAVSKRKSYHFQNCQIQSLYFSRKKTSISFLTSLEMANILLFFLNEQCWKAAKAWP